MDTSARFFQEEINVKVSRLKIHTPRPLSNPFVSGQSMRFYPQKKGTCFLVLLLAGTFIFLCLWPLKYLVPLSVGCGCGLNYTTCSSNSPAFWTSSLPQQCEPIPIINLIYYMHILLALFLWRNLTATVLQIRQSARCCRRHSDLAHSFKWQITYALKGS